MRGRPPIHYRYSCRHTACGKPHAPHRTKARKRRAVARELEDVTCSECVHVLAQRVEDALQDDPHAFTRQQYQASPRFWNIGPTGKVYTCLIE